MLKVCALIPARYLSTRLPQKLMKFLHGKTIILRTYEAVKATQLFNDVVVVCDHEILYNEIVSHGGQAMMSKSEHESGTDRIAEVAQMLDAHIFVNVQGDEPFISKDALEKVIQLFQHNNVQVGSLMLRIQDIEAMNNPNCVKVVTDINRKALYFSRSPIPYYRDEGTKHFAFQHIGVYAFRKQALLDFTKLPVSELEQIEKLENLRMLENGWSIHLAEIDHVGISIDTEADFIRAEAFLNQSEN